MSRSSTRHDREIQGKDSAGETGPEHGEKPNDNLPGGGGQPNNPATGHPVIFGSPVPGVTLTATEGTVDDLDGKPPVSSWTWRWYSGNTYIPNVSLGQYTVQDTDIGKTITAQCAFIDARGFAETRFSAPTDVVTEEPLPGAFFYHTFALANLGPFQLSRTTTETTNDYTGAPVDAPSGVPAFTGAEFNGTDNTWTDRSVGYGIRTTDGSTTLTSDFANMSPLPAGGDTNNFCGQVVYLSNVASANYVNGIYRAFALYDPANAAGTFFSVYHTKADNTWRVELNLGAGQVVVDGPVASVAAWDVVDIRYSKSSSTGLTFWINSVITEAPTHTDPFTSALTRLELGGYQGADAENTDSQVIRLSNEDLPSEEILAWQTWEEPTPILDPDLPVDPPFLHFGDTPTSAPVIVTPPQSVTVTEGQPHTFTVEATGYDSLEWEEYVTGSWQPGGTDLPIVGDNTTTSFAIQDSSVALQGQVRVTATNAVNSTSATANYTVSAASPPNIGKFGDVAGFYGYWSLDANPGYPSNDAGPVTYDWEARTLASVDAVEGSPPEQFLPIGTVEFDNVSWWVDNMRAARIEADTGLELTYSSGPSSSAMTIYSMEWRVDNTAGGVSIGVYKDDGSEHIALIAGATNWELSIEGGFGVDTGVAVIDNDATLVGVSFDDTEAVLSINGQDQATIDISITPATIGQITVGNNKDGTDGMLGMIGGVVVYHGRHNDVATSAIYDLADNSKMYRGALYTFTAKLDYDEET